MEYNSACTNTLFALSTVTPLLRYGTDKVRKQPNKDECSCRIWLTLTFETKHGCTQQSSEVWRLARWPSWCRRTPLCTDVFDTGAESLVTAATVNKWHIWFLFLVLLAICTKLVCKPPVHKKKKPVASLVDVCCSSLWTTLHYDACFLILKNNDLLPGFPTSTSTVYSHVLV